MAELVVRMATDRTRPKDPACASNRRGRQHAARSSDLEPARVRQQRDRGHLRRRSVALATRPCQITSAPGSSCSTPRLPGNASWSQCLQRRSLARASRSRSGPGVFAMSRSPTAAEIDTFINEVSLTTTASAAAGTTRTRIPRSLDLSARLRAVGGVPVQAPGVWASDNVVFDTLGQPRLGRGQIPDGHKPWSPTYSGKEISA